jgi:uncharacterized protein (DUF58 family)
VRPEPATRALAVVGGAAVALAIFLDEPVLLVMPYLIAAFLGIHAFGFFFDIRTLAHSVEIERRLEHQILRQGGMSGVSLRIRYGVPSGISIRFLDLIPAGTRIVRGAREATVDNRSGKETSIAYDLQVFSRGELSFTGLQMEVRNRYFADTLHLGRGSFRAPPLHVQPAVAFAGEMSRSEYGSHEISQTRAIQGQGIRSFRPFQTGDDRRAIDWKLSAKHGTLILREYMGKIGGSPVFFLDLPPETGSDPALWDNLASSLTTHIETALHAFSRTDVLVLSGGHIIRTLSLHQDPRPWYRLLAALPPGEGYLPLFRHPFPLVLSSLHRTAEKAAQTGGADHAFFSRLKTVTGGFRAVATPTNLERQLGAAFTGNRGREVYIFSLFRGDQSHIRATVHRAQEGKMPVHLRLPARGATPQLRHRLLQEGAASVEVLP